MFVGGYMANYKRRKPRRQVKCALCTPHRLGNSKKGMESTKAREEFQAAKRGAMLPVDEVTLGHGISQAIWDRYHVEGKAALDPANRPPLSHAPRPGDLTIRLLMGLPENMPELARKLMPMDPLPKMAGPMTAYIRDHAKRSTLGQAFSGEGEPAGPQGPA